MVDYTVITSWVTDQVKHNQFFGGMIGGGIMTSGFMMLKGFPKRIHHYSKYQLTVSMTIDSSDPLFSFVEQWIAQKMGKKARHVKLFGNKVHNGSSDDEIAVAHDSGEYTYNYYLTPDHGSYWFWYKKRIYHMERSSNSDAATTSSALDSIGRKFESITLSTTGRDPSIFKDIVNECYEFIGKRETIKFFMSDRYGWKALNSLLPRKMESVYIDDGLKQDLINDVQHFLDNKQWYRDRNIPWRRGYMFYGTPGTGKTTLAIALASYFNIPLYSINLGSIGSDAELIDNIRSIPQKTICLIEDIDVGVNDQIKRNDQEETKQKFSLSSLLNALDGVYATDGRLLIITTNDLSKLDPALIRPGRVDKKIEFNQIGNKQIIDMFHNFYGIPLVLDKNYKVIPSQLQQEILENVTQPDKVIEWIKHNG